MKIIHKVQKKAKKKKKEKVQIVKVKITCFLSTQCYICT